MKLDTPVGVIADTHGLLRDEALALLEGCGLIVHLGDVGHRDEDHRILERLEDIAPVRRVRGNIDTAAWAASMPETDDLVVNGWPLHLVHRLEDANPAPGTRVILHAHSHKPRNEWQNERLLFNPGAAGKRRFKLPITLGKLWFGEAEIKRAILHLPL
ncbi:metallophosphoesterase family protein [Halomonas aquamarina]|uniref:Metallophosphoesterase family protein n=1 Tax=Vreelandella aquamarina TaxID=77097 RepID=A0ACC5VPT5_9GAMM|nr:metallophosphoesterase family protein [Halomonas aquamarina]MBZ5486273.1 metallophosphoesterase family protein [Halomonas aquamarina]